MALSTARGERLRRARMQAGLSQGQLADKCEVDLKTIRNWENGRFRPQQGGHERLATALKKSTIELHNLLGGEYEGAPGDQCSTSPCPYIEPPARILSRITGIDDDPLVQTAAVEALEPYIHEVVNRYECEGPSQLATEVLEQHGFVRRLLKHMTSTDPRKVRLIEISARLSGLLCYMAVNLGRLSSARAYAVEAYHAADAIDHDELRAWVRATQSFAEYYAEDYPRAAALAQEGLRFAGSGSPQAIRLLINGQARALAKNGDLQGVERAVGAAYEQLGSIDTPKGMSSCISFGAYSEARVASNAATAYLALGRTERVLEFAGHAMAVADRSRSVWSQALVRLDTATALIKARRPEVHQAIVLASEAMAAVCGRDIESVRRRLSSFADALLICEQSQATTTFVEEFRAWTQTSECLRHQDRTGAER